MKMLGTATWIIFQLCLSEMWVILRIHEHKLIFGIELELMMTCLSFATISKIFNIGFVKNSESQCARILKNQDSQKNHSPLNLSK